MKQNFQILDCTFRDGGYYNNWHFEEKLVNAYFDFILRSKIKIVEIGFRFFESRGFLGPFAFSKENFIRKMQIPINLKLAVMLNASDFIKMKKKDFKKQFLPKENSRISIIRIAVHYNEIGKIKEQIQILKKFGYSVYINLMKITDKSESEIAFASRLASKYKVEAFYFADSFGNLKSSQINKILKIIRENYDGLVGIHAHNNSNWALRNTLEAINQNINLVDCTIMGMGRGAGNVCTEDLIKIFDKNNYSEIKKFIQKYFIKLKKKYNWGYSKFYHLAAKNNIHPSYIQQLLSDTRYSKHQIINIIEHLSKSNFSSYSPSFFEKIVKIKYLKNNFKIKRWSAKNWCYNKKVLIIGQGDSVKKYSEEIISFIKLYKPITISLNINKIINHKFISKFIESNEKRVILDSNYLLRYKKKLIFPAENYKGIIDEKILKKIKYNYSFKISSKSFEINKFSCVIPSSLIAIYCFAVVMAGCPKDIFLVGMDGYDKNDFNTSQINDYYYYLKNKYRVKFISLTKTNYNFETESIFKYI
jgi:4-hydroxy 2-oxovalerate aldolase